MRLPGAPQPNCRYLSKPVDQVLVFQFRARIGQRTLGHAQGHAHLGEANADRLGVENLDAGRASQVARIDYIGNQGAAKRHDDFRAGVINERSDELHGDPENLILALRDVTAVNAEGPDVADKAVEAIAAQDAPCIRHVRGKRDCDADAIGKGQCGVHRGAAQADDRNANRKPAAVDPRIERVAGNDGIIAVLFRPEDFPHDGWRLHHMMQAVEAALGPEHFHHAGALEVVRKANFDRGARGGIAVELLFDRVYLVGWLFCLAPWGLVDDKDPHG